MQRKTIGTLFSESRLIAKTINRIEVEGESINFLSCRNEAKLLCFEPGNILSSATLLVKGKHVPSYGIDGRCYGILLNAEDCYIYDVNSTDANTNSTDKLKKRNERQGINFLTSNSQGHKTLDELSAEIKSGKDGQMNEVLLDAKLNACVGLFVRKINLEKADPKALKQYYQSLLEIRLIQKYLIQAYLFPADLKICLYGEIEGSLYKFPSDEELISQARMAGINEKTHPKIFEFLSEKYQFPKFQTPQTVEQFLLGCSPLIVERVLKKLADSHVPFDGKKLTAVEIKKAYVDNVIGVGESIIQETIESCEKEEADSQVLSLQSMFASKLEIQTSSANDARMNQTSKKMSVQ